MLWSIVMAGRGPAIHVFFTVLIEPSCMGGSVYIMTNRRDGTLYISVTNNLLRRVWEHREGVGSNFVRRYQLTRLVYFEHHEDIRNAIQRETNLKRWPRAWKVRLLASGKPEWTDLYPTMLTQRRGWPGRARP
jgi:putative endonuclease